MVKRILAIVILSVTTWYRLKPRCYCQPTSHENGCT